MEINDIATWITTDATDDDIAQIQEAIKARREILILQTSATLRRGSRVEVRGISPKSMDGATGIVQDIKRKRASVLFDEEQPRGVYFGRFQASWRNKMPLGVPIACLRAL